MKKLAEKHMKILGDELPSAQEINWINYFEDDREEKHKLVVPRYMPWTGWVEIFFLSPQEEWVELSGVDDFSGHEKGILNGDIYEEKVSWKKDLKKKEIKFHVRRDFDDLSKGEEGTYLESWKDIDETGKAYGTWNSSHKNGYLSTEITKTRLKSDGLGSLDDVYERFCEAAKERILDSKREGEIEGTQIWRKNWKVKGTLPGWKRELAPIKEVQSGTCLEIGFIYLENHGDWYKLMELEDGKKFLIMEEGFEWDSYSWKGKETKGKRGYHLYLYQLDNIEEAIDILKDPTSGLVRKLSESEKHS